jgi:hypothetical protein
VCPEKGNTSSTPTCATVGWRYYRG